MNSGGLIGYMKNSIITNCYTTGNIELNVNSSDYARIYLGGLIGCIYVSATIKNCYVTGNVKCYGLIDFSIVNGLCENLSYITVIDCYRYNEQVVENSNGTINDTGTSADMQTIWAFVSSNWDSSVWNLYSDKNPTLKI